MKLLIRYKWLMLAAVVLFSSCRKDKLSPIPETVISDAVAFQTPARALQTINGLYAAVKTGQFYGGRYIVYNDIRGEEFNNRTQNGITAYQTYNYTVTSGLAEAGNLWNAAYAAINRMNVVIAGLQTAPLSDQVKAQYTAEARFLRGMSYFSLVTLYARPYWDGNGDKPGVVVYTEPQTTGGNNSKARSTVAETYNQILADLTYAEQNLPATYGAGSPLNLTRAHKNTAIALKTRVYLTMRKYAEVITEANKIVSAAAPFTATSGVPLSLAPKIADVFGANGSTPENIFSFPFTSNDLPGTQNSLNQYFSPGPGGNGDYALNATSGIVTNTTFWSATDARRDFNQVTSGQTWLRKWTANTDNVPVIRYAEVLLNLAEALARTNGQDVRAIALLNAVHKRSDPATTLVPVTADELINMILLERRIELLGEGFRSLDLLRLAQPLPAKPGVSSTVAPNETQYIWPIPNGELLVNKAAAQNSGY